MAKTICQDHIETWEASLDYYRARMRRCYPNEEPRVAELIALNQNVLRALHAFNDDYLAMIKRENESIAEREKNDVPHNS
jgi:hypothetical protein